MAMRIIGNGPILQFLSTCDQTNIHVVCARYIFDRFRLTHLRIHKSNIIGKRVKAMPVNYFLALFVQDD